MKRLLTMMISLFEVLTKRAYRLDVAPKVLLNELLYSYHYLHRKSGGYKSGANIGLWHDNDLVGACVFTGFPVPEIVQGAFGLDRNDQVGFWALSNNAHTIMHNAMHEITRIVNDDNYANPTIKQLTELADIAARKIRCTNPDGLSHFQVIKRITDATEQAYNGLNRLVARWGFEVLEQYNSRYMTNLEWDGIES
mgnify:CR=1 FL=1